MKPLGRARVLELDRSVPAAVQIVQNTGGEFCPALCHWLANRRATRSRARGVTSFVGGPRLAAPFAKVYEWCMKRTNVVLDDKLVARARKLTGTQTTRDILDRALRELVAREEQRRLARKLQGSGWVGDLESMRKVR
jgi:Arc/MetJ family transcription regulator